MQVEMLESLVEREVEERSKLLQSFERAKKELNLLKIGPGAARTQARQTRAHATCDFFS